MKKAYFGITTIEPVITKKNYFGIRISLMVSSRKEEFSSKMVV